MICVYRCSKCNAELELMIKAHERTSTKVECDSCSKIMDYVEIPKPSIDAHKCHIWARPRHKT